MKQSCKQTARERKKKQAPRSQQKSRQIKQYINKAHSNDKDREQRVEARIGSVEKHAKN